MFAGRDAQQHTITHSGAAHVKATKEKVVVSVNTGWTRLRGDGFDAHVPRNSLGFNAHVHSALTALPRKNTGDFTERRWG